MMSNKTSIFWTTVILLVARLMQAQIDAVGVNGVCLGLNGNDLPSATDIINVYNKYSIVYMRLFEPVPEVMRAVADTGLFVILGVRNEDVPKLASSIQGATDWINNFLKMYRGGIILPYIAVGNEMVPGQLAQYIPQAMINLKAALVTKGLTGIMVTTVISLNVLATSYPPSAGAFTDEARPIMVDILRILSQEKTPCMVNVYPYFAYASNPGQISLDYALFNAQGPVVQDGPYSYSNLFDAMVDAFNSAMDREGITDVRAMIAESGWPSAGNGAFTTPEIASTYNRNLARHLLTSGTPRRPSGGDGGMFFAMFDENLKPGDEVERHFGFFHPNMEPVYPLPKFPAVPPPVTNNTLLGSLDIDGITVVGLA